MKPFERLLVTLAGDASDAGLLAYARMVATLVPGTQFSFVHVLGSQIPDHDHATQATQEQALRHIRECVEQHFGSSTTPITVLHGPRVDRLLELAADWAADLILMGHRRPGGRRSLARRLAMKAPCSVWMVPDGCAARISQILAPIDFSSHSAYALSVGAWIASRAGLERISALHVYFDAAIAGYDEYRESVRGRENQEFANFIAPLELHGLRVDPLFEESARVAHAVEKIGKSSSVDLVVMGTRGRSLSAAILLGSQSEQVLMETTLPVLVVKHQGERIGLLQILLDRDFQGQPGLRFG